MKLTGNCRYRSNWFGKLILQVQYSQKHYKCEGMDYDIHTHWRDARIQDLTIIQSFVGEFNDPV